MYPADAAEGHEVTHLAMTGDPHVVREDDVVADLAVVGDMRGRHQEAIVADARLHAAALGAWIDGHVLADDATLADDQAAGLAMILEVLRLVPDRSEGIDPRGLADLGAAGDRHVRDKLDAFMEDD